MLDDLASAFSIDRRTAGNHLKRRGVQGRCRKLSDEQIAEAVELYQGDSSLAQIAERFGVYPQSMRYRLQRAGIELRPRPGWRS